MPSRAIVWWSRRFWMPVAERVTRLTSSPPTAVWPVRAVSRAMAFFSLRPVAASASSVAPRAEGRLRTGGRAVILLAAWPGAGRRVRPRQGPAPAACGVRSGYPAQLLDVAGGRALPRPGCRWVPGGPGCRERSPAGRRSR
jgi:hypothetical protein